MTLPALTNTEVQGRLNAGAVRDSALCCVIGGASTGPLQQLNVDSRVSSIVSTNGLGPMPELAAQVAAEGKTVCYLRIPSTAGANSAVAHTGTGASMTVSGSAFDAYQVIVRVDVGGTVGTNGIKLSYSLNGGYSWQPQVSLGASDVFTIPNTGLTIDFANAPATLVAGEMYTFTSAAPDIDAADITTAFQKIKLSNLAIDSIFLTGAAIAADLQAFDAGIKMLKAFGKNCWGAAEVRMPVLAFGSTPAETDAAYRDSISAALANVTTDHFAVAAFAGRTASAITGVVQRRSPLYGSINDLTVANISASAAAIAGNAANAVLTDDLGNTIEHDEFLSGETLSDRFLVYRTWPGQSGVYLTQTQLLSTPASSFQLIQHRRIVNRAEDIANAYMAQQVHQPLAAKPDGTITVADAKRLDQGLTAALNAGLKGHASNVVYKCDRTSVITTVPSKLAGDLQLQPFGYPSQIETRIILTAQVQS